MLARYVRVGLDFGVWESLNITVTPKAGNDTRVDIQELRSKAEAGSVVSQGILGISYLYGLDVPKDCAVALHWLTLAAERGASRPTFHLGRMHEEGWGV